MWTIVPSEDEQRDGVVFKDHVRLPDGMVHVRYNGTVTVCDQSFDVAARLSPQTPVTCEVCEVLELISRD